MKMMPPTPAPVSEAPSELHPAVSACPSGTTPTMSASAVTREKLVMVPQEKRARATPAWRHNGLASLRTYQTLSCMLQGVGDPVSRGRSPPRFYENLVLFIGGG